METATKHGLRRETSGIGGNFVKNVKTQKRQLWGHFWGEDPTFSPSKVADMKACEHFEWIEAPKNNVL
jgi:hypothetical protein